ncbi:MAG: hypothetical protein NTV51_06040 [Verrucomicrobia bacterium]|nr:hypothetical protein [Verrucomicrobiota bacterium]
MYFLAAATTTVDKLKEIPPDFWWKTLFAVVALVALVIFLRKVAKMNKVVLAVVVMITFTVVGFNWIYERNEPAWASPVVNWLAGFFPSKGVPATKPPNAPGTPKRN